MIGPWSNSVAMHTIAFIILILASSKVFERIYNEVELMSHLQKLTKMKLAFIVKI